jgi:hypothetical protein
MYQIKSSLWLISKLGKIKQQELQSLLVDKELFLVYGKDHFGPTCLFIDVEEFRFFLPFYRCVNPLY